MPEGAPPFNRRAAVVLAVLSGVLHGACFPPAAIWVAAFVALGPLVAAVRGRRTVVAFGLGWLEGTVAFAIAAIPWIAAASHDYFRQGWPAAVGFAAVLSQIFSAAPSAVFAALSPGLARRCGPVVRVLAGGATWMAVELVRSWMLTGAPWDLLAHALYEHPLWIQTADLGGASLVTFVLAVGAMAAAEVIVAPRREAGWALGAAVVVLALAAGYGALRLQGEQDGGPSLRVGLVQADIPNGWRGDVARADDALRLLAEPTRRLRDERPELVLWPENAVSFLLAPNARFLDTIADVLGAEGAPLVLGAPRYAQTGDGRVAFYNSAYLVSPAGRVLAVYDKRHLLPFAEYAPFPGVGWLGSRVDAPGSFTPGTTPGVFTLPEPFGVLICFEAIYPELIRDLVRGGARFLVNTSNDGWFAASGALEQHFATTVFRAVETRRAVARTANQGVTAVVGPSGRVLMRSQPGRPGAWVVPVPLRDGLTFYTRHGDLVGWIGAAAALAALFHRRRG